MRELQEEKDKALAEECSALIHRKLPPKLKDPGRFTISCSKGKANIREALCDLGCNINLMPLSMV
ncbi:hypothetical protein A2U01_0102463, partial [Trifolium medium]|nr:hypothetical protein [Trifolium medium]